VFQGEIKGVEAVKMLIWLKPHFMMALL